MFDYSPLWETMRKKNISQYKLISEGIDKKTLDSLRKGRCISLVTVERLCHILNCEANEIVRFKQSEQNTEQ